MIFELKLAVRFMQNRRRGLVRFTAFAAVAGIAAGIASLIIAQAVTRGFQTEMQDKILANTPHIVIFPKDGGRIANWRVLLREIKAVENVEQVTAAGHKPALLSGPDGTSYADLRTNENSGGEDEINIAIGAELAITIGLQNGSSAQIIAPEHGEAPKTFDAKVSETFKTGLFDYDSTWVEISQADFAKISGDAEFIPTVLNITAADIYQTDAAAKKIRGLLGDDFRVIDWQEANRPLFTALSFEKKAAQIVISLIMFVAVLNITTTLALLVNERRHDIAILRTCGARTGTLAFIFILKGLLLGVAGVVVGIFFGLAGCFAANYFKLAGLSAEVYLISYIPLRPTGFDIAFAAAIAFVLCLAATVYPAFLAARLRPMENLRSVG